MGGFEEEVQSNLDGINIILAKNYDHVKSIEQCYDEHGNDELDKDKMRKAVLNGTVPTGIAGMVVLAHCGQPSTSNCERYQLNADPFIPSGKKCNKIFSMALGNIAPADSIERLPFEAHQPSGRGAYGDRHQAQSIEYESICRSKIYHIF